MSVCYMFDMFIERYRYVNIDVHMYMSAYMLHVHVFVCVYINKYACVCFNKCNHVRANVHAQC